MTNTPHCNTPKRQQLSRDLEAWLADVKATENGLSETQWKEILELFGRYLGDPLGGIGELFTRILDALNVDEQEVLLDSMRDARAARRQACIKAVEGPKDFEARRSYLAVQRRQKIQRRVLTRRRL